MDTIFFIASKVIWALISPDSLIVLLGVSAWLALIFGWHKISRRVLALCAFLLLFIGFLRIGDWAISPLGNRFVANTAPAGAGRWHYRVGGRTGALSFPGMEPGTTG